MTGLRLPQQIGGILQGHPYVGNPCRDGAESSRDADVVAHVPKTRPDIYGGRGRRSHDGLLASPDGRSREE